ncbi:MAG: hypothetical protein Q9168_001252 [Polycauliona sp. 1 TL-2023]
MSRDFLAPSVPRSDGIQAVGRDKLRFMFIHSLERFLANIIVSLNGEMLIMEFFSVNGYIHRDLKPNNCLLHDSGKGGLRVLVSDFGEAQLENMARKSTGATGTISYCAPEVLRRNDFGALGQFTTKSDIFSLGMILYFLCFSRLPYQYADNLDEENEDLEQLRDEITSWSGLQEERKLRPDLPEKLYTFLRRLLSLTPADRPSAEEILFGIKTGSGLDEISDARPPSASHMFDDLRNSSRISPIDSPQSGTPRPPTPTRRQSTTGFRRPGAMANLRLSSFQRAKNAAEQSLPAEEGSHSPSDSLILREQYPSPTRQMAQLPAPRRSPSRLTIGRFAFPRASGQRSVKLILLLIKMLSINMMCNPMAARSTIAYPLLALTACDIVFINLGLGISAILAIAHVLLMWTLSASATLCVSRARAWEDYG